MGRPIFEHELLLREFVPVVDTYESGIVELHDVSSKVEAYPHLANRWGKNQGVIVVYDHRGHPYIRCHDLTPREKYELGLSLKDVGAYVPHSNDNGWWTSENLPQPYKPPMPSSIL